jgi:hypothetical protein
MGKRNRQKFADIWLNQTNLGKQFGLSSIAMGKKLKELQLKDADGKPTDQALAEGYCTSTPLKDGIPFFMWHGQKVATLMQSKGYQKLDSQEFKARELADEWIHIHKQYQAAIYGIEEELLIDEAQNIAREARRKGLINRVNEILREKKFNGELPQ